MNISSVNSTQLILAGGNKSSNKLEPGVQQFRNIIENKRIVKDESSNVWENLSNEYDVNNGTFADVIRIANSLYEAGEISIREVDTMTFGFGRASHDLKQVASGISSNFSMYETNANEDGKRNWIEEFEARANKNFKFDNLLGYNNNMKISSLLHKLERG